MAEPEPLREEVNFKLKGLNYNLPYHKRTFESI